jgi:pilus assembly protein CpaB
MNSNESRSFWISVGAALLAIALMYSHNQTRQAEYIKKFGATKRVVIAAQQIRAMETLNETLLEVVERPAEYTDPNAVSDPDVLIGQVAAAPIGKGEQVLTNKLLEPGPDTGIALQVAPNRRAISIPIDSVRGVAKLLKPGDRIDIIASLIVGKGVDQVREVKTILQDVPVLATGKRVVNNIPRMLELDEGSGKKYWINMAGDIDFDTITIEANPKASQELITILTESPGNIFVTLRNPNDRKLERLPTSTMETILGKAGGSGKVGGRAAPKVRRGQ